MFITDDRMKKAVVRALLDDHSRLILSSTISEPRSVADIVRGHNVPMTSAYRRVKELVDQGLMKVERTVVTDAGKRYDLYRSTIRRVEVLFDGEMIEVNVTPLPVPTAVDRMLKRFYSLREGG